MASAPIWLLILTMGCGAVGLTIISPSLKSVAEEFDVDSATAQFLLSGYFIAIASSQLIYGPMSDRYGRRKPLLIGMGLYAMGGILGVYAASITTLIYARILQGLGAAATVSMVRAIINDSYDRTKGASVFATISAVMVIAPIFSFISGGLVDEMIGWKGTMVIIALAGGLSLVSNYFFLNETNLNPMGKIVPRLLISEYYELFSNRLFLAFVIASAMQRRYLSLHDWICALRIFKAGIKSRRNRRLVRCHSGGLYVRQFHHTLDGTEMGPRKYDIDW